MFALAHVFIRHLASIILCDCIPRWTFALWLVLENGAVSFCTGLREHIFAKRCRNGRICLPFWSVITFFCASTRCCAVSDSTGLNVIDSLSGFQYSQAAAWVFLSRFCGSRVLAAAGSEKFPEVMELFYFLRGVAWIRLVPISESSTTWSLSCTTRVGGQILKVGIAGVLEGLTLIFGDICTSRCFTILGRTNFAVGFVVYRQKRVQACDRW